MTVETSSHEILEHSETEVDYTVFSVNWVPSSPRLIVFASYWSIRFLIAFDQFVMELSSFIFYSLKSNSLKRLLLIGQFV